MWTEENRNVVLFNADKVVYIDVLNLLSYFLLECPGGAKEPCNGHGKCKVGNINGSHTTEYIISL